MTPGLVSLVGAGPGAPDLLTRRAHQRLREADLVFHDGLVPAPIVRLARSARTVSVARRQGPKLLSHRVVIDVMVSASLEGRRVVRLKAGDPFIFGRGHEEASALAAAGVPFEIVPGLSSATAAPVLAGIPLTQRGVASGVLVVSGHARSSFEPLLSVVPAHAVTLVVLMGMHQRAELRDVLIAAGWPSETPAAIVTNASRKGQHVWTGTLAALPGGRAIDSPPRPGVIVVGRVAASRTPGLFLAPNPLRSRRNDATR